MGEDSKSKWKIYLYRHDLDSENTLSVEGEDEKKVEEIFDRQVSKLKSDNNISKPDKNQRILDHYIG